MEKIMLDPRQEIMEMIHGVRESLNALEMKLWEIPHHEPVEEYEEVFVAPAVGDYMHPSTPTHPCPEGLGDGAYWDECCQCWMQPNEYEWDDSNLLTNYHTDMTYLPEHGNVWVEESANDWSNGYADDWYVAPTEIVEEYVEPVPAPVMPAHDEVHYETTDNGNTIDAPAPDMEPVPAPVEAEYHEEANVEMYFHDEANVHVEEAPMPSTMDGFQQAGTDAPQDGPDFSDTDAIHDVMDGLLDDDDSAPTT